MKICHESPLELLEVSLEYNDYQYILPHYYVKYSQYKNFMLEYRKQPNSFIILDNGIFEGDIFPENELISMIQEIEPDIFIIPDSWNNATESQKNAKYWVNVMSSQLPKRTKLRGVIQCTDLMVGSSLYQQYIDLGIRHIAFNHSSVAYKEFFPHKNELISKMMGRIYFINKLEQMNILDKTVYHHLLGCSLPQEFMYYEGYDFIKSVDTSNPVIFGMLGKIYEPKGMFEKPSQQIEVFMEEDCSKHTGTVMYNINYFKNLIQN